MATRRGFIKVVGSTAVVLAAGGTWFGTTRFPAEARAPWSQAGQDYEDPRLFALSYGILAPNPHNRQPWMVDLIGNDQARLYCDPERLLPATDPFNRQITIGLGCFLELTRMAALARGYHMEMTPFPEGAPQTHLDQRPIASLVFSKTEAGEDRLFKTVLDRRSNKEPFDTTRSVSQKTLDQLLAGAGPTLAAGGIVEPDQLEPFRQLTWEAYLVEMHTPPALQESIDVMRFTKGQINQNPDGIDLGGPMLEGMYRTGLLGPEQMADPQSVAFKSGLDIYANMIMSAMGYVWLISPGNSREQQLIAGRDWLRLNLQATALGLAIHPLSQALQEYPEMEPHYLDIHERLATKEGETVQMFGRIGYGKEVPPAPRWKLETRLV